MMSFTRRLSSKLCEAFLILIGYLRKFRFKYAYQKFANKGKIKGHCGSPILKENGNLSHDILGWYIGSPQAKFLDNQLNFHSLSINFA